MSILVVGSIAIDTIETPYGNAEESYGGSALYFSAAASHFAPVNLVGVVGKDFDFDKIAFLKDRRVDFRGIAVMEGKTFRWGGRYKKDINQRDTLFTMLNVFEEFSPKIPSQYQKSDLVFLANIDPELQMDVLNQIEKPKLTVLDTMNFWISGKRDALMNIIRRSDVVILNDEEMRELTKTPNLFKGARLIMAEGPRAVVVKKGEHGAFLFTRDGFFQTPAFPVEKVVDPTGAGDSFAGGFLGYLATCTDIGDRDFQMAMVYGTLVASFVVEDFSYTRLRNIDRNAIDQRVTRLREMTRF